MNRSCTYDFMQSGEENEVCDLVLRVFDHFVAPSYSNEGVREFRSYITPELLIKRSQENCFVLLARLSDKIVGMIEIRQHHHISLFFVDADFQTEGIGRVLFQKAIARCQNKMPGINQFSVNSSPYALPIYKRLGFQKTDKEQIKNGIRFIPMSLKFPTSK